MSKGIGEKYLKISIHALREEGDLLALILSYCILNFYPRPPRGGRLQRFQRHDQRRVISIHALREEGDVDDFSFKGNPINFYPRPPRGGRRASAISGGKVEVFLSTPPAWWATYFIAPEATVLFFSSPALREVGDVVGCCGEVHAVNDFYPRPPRGGRPASITYGGLEDDYFYPRPPRGGRLRSG